MTGRRSNSEFRTELGSTRMRPSLAAVVFDERAGDSTLLTRQAWRPTAAMSAMKGNAVGTRAVLGKHSK